MKIASMLKPVIMTAFLMGLVQPPRRYRKRGKPEPGFSPDIVGVHAAAERRRSGNRASGMALGMMHEITRSFKCAAGHIT